MKPIVAITIGDPAGIGPEITGKALRHAAIHRVCTPLVIGDISRVPGLERSCKSFGCSFFNIPPASDAHIVCGIPSKDSGRASYEYLLAALQMLRHRQAHALVTAPISKDAIHRAGVHFPGHTELLAEHTDTQTYAMMMAAGNLRTIMVTRHIPTSAVGRALTVNDIVSTASLAHAFLKKHEGIGAPHIGICALNPHAGEAGLIGTEEQTVLIPAIKKLRARSINAVGPLGADSAWQHHAAGEFDILITMYHDQAMIPLKCLAPERIVNITVGLPFIRTSPGHGTACDIAGQNKADPRPMIEAILTAARLSSNA